MTQNQINYLRKQIPADWKYARQDFEKYDVKSLAKCEGRIIFTITQPTTSITEMGTAYMLANIQNEQFRLSLLQDVYFSSGLRYHCRTYHDRIVIIEYDGCGGFRSLTPEKAMQLYESEMKPWVEYIKQTHKEEALCFDAQLELDITCPDLWKQMTELNESIGGNLMDIISHLKQWNRRAVNHKIVIGKDWAKNSFQFCEFVNDKPRVNGGIIFYNNKWSLHT